MMEAQAVGPVMRGNRTANLTAFLFGAVIYFTSLFTILYAVGFVSGFAAPKMIDTGVKPGAFEAIVVNLVLLSLFADQHSVMARRRSEQWSYREWVSRPFPWRKLT
jgi:methanethiol S-methyltransferase